MVMVYRLVLLAAVSVAAQAVDRSASLFWENGNVSSGLDPVLEASFSINSQSSVTYVANDLHNLSAVKVDWAREGDYVLKVYADGRNYDTDEDYAWRSELGAVDAPYKFYPGEEHYFTASFRPDDSWDQVGQYSTVISQWKMTGGDPHAALRLSNLGDYELFFRSDLWSGESDEGRHIGYASPNTWTDVKVYFNMSLGDSGIVKVWLNGDLVFFHNGTTILRDDYGYVKFGMYTEIVDQRNLYFDAVEFTNRLNVSMAEWLSDRDYTPTVRLTSPRDGAVFASGSMVTVSANASDPAGKKLFTEGNLSHVEFFVGNCSVGTDDTSPYNVSFTPVDGSYTLYAVVTDSDGNTATSDSITVKVGNQEPSVWITSPARLDNFVSGRNVTISVNATDTDGHVVQVRFLVDGVAIATMATTSDRLYTAVWQPTTSGAASLVAIATDDDGSTGESSTVYVTVDATVTNTTLVRADDDASLRQASPTSTGNWGDVEVYGNPSSQIVGVFQFNISQFSQAAQVREATLSLYTTTVGSAAYFSVYRAANATEPWDESTVTWTNGPDRAALVSSTYVDTTGQYFDFDVTDYVSDLADASTEMITFWLADPSTDYKRIEVESSRSDKDYPPRLQVTTSDTVIPDNDASSNGTNCDSLFANTTLAPTSEPTTAAPTMLTPSSAPTLVPSASPTPAPSINSSSSPAPTLSPTAADTGAGQGRSCDDGTPAALIGVLSAVLGVVVGFAAGFAAASQPVEVLGIMRRWRGGQHSASEPEHQDFKFKKVQSGFSGVNPSIEVEQQGAAVATCEESDL